MAVGNEVWCLENSVYSVLSPEGFAAILWKDGKRADEAAEVMKMTSEHLKNLKVVDRIFKEPEPVHVDSGAALAIRLKQAMSEFFRRYDAMDAEAIVRERYERFRRF
jgi:acetyl-CoA carboxylase alpha subunit